MRRRISAPPTKPEPPVTKALGTPAKLPLRGGEVLLALGQADRLVLHEVADRDLALLDPRQCPVATVVGEPLRAADRGRREAADGAELPGSVAPEMTYRAVLRSRDAADQRVGIAEGLRAALEAAAVQEDVGQSLEALGLVHLEDALVELGGIRTARAVVDHHSDATLAGVDDGSVREMGLLRDLVEHLFARQLD